MKKIEYPGNDDLRGLVRFSTEDGLIWLGESRMLLLHVATMAGLRRELILSVGIDDARRTIIRMGYEAGLRDAEIVRRIRRNDDDLDAYIAGPQLFMLEGGERGRRSLICASSARPTTRCAGCGQATPQAIRLAFLVDRC